MDEREIQEIEARLSTCSNPTLKDAIRDLLTAVVEADPAVTVKAGNPGWAAIDIFRSGQSVGRIYAKRGKVQINNFIPESKSGDYGPNVPLGDKGQWSFVLKSEDDIDLILQCLADNIAHLGGRRVRPNAGQSGLPRSNASRASGRSNPSLSRSTRFRVLIRDNYTCQYCGRSAPNVELQVDHRTPVSLGGGNEPENLVTACAECNLGKSNRFIT